MNTEAVQFAGQLIFVSVLCIEYLDSFTLGVTAWTSHDIQHCFTLQFREKVEKMFQVWNFTKLFVSAAAPVDFTLEKSPY